jgi:hypothetical protein
MKLQFSENREKAIQTLGDEQMCKLTRLACRSICVGFALLETWSGRQFLNQDGVSYLDMSDAFLRHDLHLLSNPLWSPLYPLLIGVATWLTHPSARWEVRIAHLLNFIIFLGALASFEFLLRQVIRVLGPEDGRQGTDSEVPLSAWRWQLIGYSLFAWSTFGVMLAPRMITPDLCVAMFVYLDCGLLLSLRHSTKTSRTCLLLGLTLGFGYLAKAILFPMAFLFIVAAFFVIGDWRKAAVPLAITFLVFCAVSAPLFISISRSVGRPSYSEAGSLNYAWHVNREDWPFFSSASGPPAYFKHPIALLHTRPDVFGFRDPQASTFPPRQNPQPWCAGGIATFNARNQLRAIKWNLIAAFSNAHTIPMWGLIGGSLVLLLIGPNVPERLRKVRRSWPLLIPGVVAPLLYFSVWVEPRYLAPFLALVLLGLLPGILVQQPMDAASRTAMGTVVVAVSLIIMTALFVFYHLAGFPHGDDDGEIYVHAAVSMNRAGMQPGDEVALIGDGGDGCRWARMARVRIVAQIRPEDADAFWQMSAPQGKAEVYDALAKTGVKAVVTEETLPAGGFADWQRLGDTRYSVHFLDLATSK